MNHQNECCALHGRELRAELVPVTYGLPSPDEELQAARAALFPNSRRSVHGGCVIEDFDAKWEAAVCDDCREAETEWYVARKPNRRGVPWSRADFDAELSELCDGEDIAVGPTS